MKRSTILGVSFFGGSLEAAVTSAMQGGLVVAPSAPGLACDFIREPAYREALLKADLVLTDSGYLVLLWRIMTGEALPRHSGLKFIRAILDLPELRETGASFWVMPSAEEDERNRAWLNRRGIPVEQRDVYLAPRYRPGSLSDASLLSIIEERRPKVIVIGIGGGVQERLGLYLRNSLSYRPTILCIGAAIAFVTGGQVSIPPWADTLMLGWLLRICSSPARYFSRYWNAKGLALLVWRYRDRLPSLRGEDGQA